MTSSDAPAPGDDVFRLIYRSRSLVPPGERDAELGAIFSSARRFNKDHDITGALLLLDDMFVQTLEGDETAVRALYDRIAEDARHEDVTVVDAQGGRSRVFTRWSMAKVGQDGDADIPLLAVKDGVKRAQPRPVTADQEDVLDLMRETARGDSVSA